MLRTRWSPVLGPFSLGALTGAAKNHITDLQREPEVDSNS